MDQSTPIRVACAIIPHPGNRALIFAAKRSKKSKNLPGKWEFPGGKIEPDESVFDAITREIEEELGLNIFPQENWPSSTHDYSVVSVELIPVLCETRQSSFSLHEHEAADWFPLTKLQKLDWAPADLPVLKQVQDYLGNTGSTQSPAS